MKTALLTLIGVTLLATGCYHTRIDSDEIEVMENGDRVPSNERSVLDATRVYETNRQAGTDARNDAMAEALATCTGSICEAVTQGEVALGMTRAQVLAATRTGESAWQTRQSAHGAVLMPLRSDDPPSDRVADIALVQLRDGRVSAYSYRESSGVRLISQPADATTEGRADALADMLIREGDDYAARGDFDAALNRYDRASILRPADPMIQYRMATTLDKWSRPIEAQIRYQLFLHQLELERIAAVGEVYANIAEAEAYARARILTLEHHEH